MKIKVKKLKTKSRTDLEYLKNIFKANKIPGDAAIIFQGSEDCYFEGTAKQCTQEFYEMIYGAKGPYWDVYSKLGFAVKSGDTIYNVFILGRQYLIKNLENRFYSNNGLEKYYKIEKDLLTEKKHLNSANFFMSLSYIFDYAKSVNLIAQLNLMSGEYIDKFEVLQKKIIDFYEFYSKETNLSNPVKIARESLAMANKAVRFLIIATLYEKFGIRIRESKSISLCELESLSNLIKNKNVKDIKKYYGFYSFYPYDISKPRFYEEFGVFENCSDFDIPKDYSFRLKENARFLVARSLDIERRCYRKIGEMTKLGELIFYIKVSELKKVDLDEKSDMENLRRLAQKRNNEFINFQKEELPEKLFLQKGELYIEDKEKLKSESKYKITAKSVSSRKIVEGIAVTIDSIDEFSKFKRGSIILTKKLSPNHAALFRNAKGIVSKGEGAATYIAAIAKEMNLPCFIQTNAVGKIKEGQCIRLNGRKGDIEILNKVSYKENDKKNSDHLLEVKPEPHKSKNIADVNKIGLNRQDNKGFYWLGGEILRNSAVGTKTANLSALYKYFSVPLGFSLAAAYFQNVVKSKSINLMNAELQKLDTGNMPEIDDYCKKIKDNVLNVEFDHEFEKEIKENLDKLDAKTVAVRSSVFCEDQRKLSFAEQYDSFLNLKSYEEIKTAIKKCWASYFNPRAVAYRRQNHIEDKKILLSVFIQKMAEAKYSGVIFTEDLSDINTIVIKVVEGVYDKSVSRSKISNFYVMDRESMSILKVRMEFELNERIIENAAKMAIEIEKKLGSAQNIEWCIDESGRLWVLQSSAVSF